MLKLYSKKKHNPTISVILWIFFISVSIYLFWIIINPTQKGVVGNFIFNWAFSLFGHSIYLFPFIFFYGSIRILLKFGKLNKGILSLVIGSFITITSISAIAEYIHYQKILENAKGGWLGYFTDSILRTLFGSTGGVIFSVAMFVIGLNIIFEIRWKEIFIKTAYIIKKDWKEWKHARAELCAKIEKVKKEEELIKKTKQKPDQTFERIEMEPHQTIQLASEPIL
ncbi:MAG: DNA translocase FtsK 4TM domain-containing protein, partial [Elusimicrobiales bacterium]